MRLVQAAAALIVILIGGCSTFHYEEPEAGDRARVRFAVVNGDRAQNQTALHTADARVIEFEQSACGGQSSDWMYLLNGFLANPSPRRLGMPLWEYHENGAKEVFVRADQTLHLMMVGSTATWNGVQNVDYYCGVPINWQFEPNEDYELVLRVDGGTQCSVALNQFRQTNEGVQRVQIQRFDNSTLSEACFRALA